MAQLLKFDKVNKFETEKKVEKKRNIVSIDQYFGEMNLTPKQHRQRVGFAKEFFDDVLLMFALYNAMLHYGGVDEAELRDRFIRDYTDKAMEYIDIDENVEKHIQKSADDIIGTTLKYDSEYYTSDDRATLIAENEANSLMNYDDYVLAKKQGRTTKTWSTIMDGRERDDHAEADGMTVGIDDPFYVGGSQLMYPGDISLNASPDQIINCRCSVKYT